MIKAAILLNHKFNHPSQTIDCSLLYFYNRIRYR